MKIGTKLLIIQLVLLFFIAVTFYVTFAYFVITHNTSNMYMKANQIAVQMQTTLKFADTQNQQKIVEKLISVSEDLSYILVLDTAGKAIVHSEPDRIGKVFDDEGTLSCAKFQKIVQQEYLRDKDKPESIHYRERCLDILVPFYNVSGKHIGAVNIGLSFKAIDAETQKYYLIMGGSLLIIVIIIGLIWLYNHKNLVKPIVKISNYANKLSNGIVDFEIKTNSKDEIGDLYRAFGMMKNNLENIISDIEKFTDSAGNGKLDYRINFSKYEGKFCEILKGINNTVDSIIRPFNVTAEYVDRISKGDLPKSLSDDFKGDFNEIKNNVNMCIASIKQLVDDSNKLFSNAMIGNLNYRADVNRHNGEFRNIISGVNATMDRLVGLIDEMPIKVQITDVDNKILYSNKYNQ